MPSDEPDANSATDATPEELRTLCADIAHQAGSFAHEQRRRLGAGSRVAHDTKSSDVDPVTEFDRATEVLVVDRLRAERPDDSIVGEEGADHQGTSDLEWHIDPIDGTVNFVYDLPGVVHVGRRAPRRRADRRRHLCPGRGRVVLRCARSGRHDQRGIRSPSPGRTTSPPVFRPPDSATTATTTESNKPSASPVSCRRSATSDAKALRRSTSPTWPRGASMRTSRSSSTRGMSLPVSSSSPRRVAPFQAFDGGELDVAAPAGVVASTPALHTQFVTMFVASR